MSKEIYISSTPHETRLAIVESDELAEIYYERENEYTLAGSIYNGKVTRVLPGMQSSFVDIGLERDAFLYITDFMEEAGDSADFESGEGNGRGRSRENSRPDEKRADDRRPDDRRDDRRRDGNRVAAAPEGVPAEDEVVRAVDQPRSDRGSERGGDRGSERSSDRGSERGDNRRDRGRRRPDSRDDRSGNRDRRPNVIASEAAPAPPAPSIFLPEPVTGLDLTSDSELPPTDIASLGEGALGADGSRRWRGRRGRRRGGRGPNPIAGQEAGPQDGSEFEPAGNLVNEPGGFDPGYNLGTSADAFDTTEAEASGTFDIDAQAEIVQSLETKSNTAGESSPTTEAAPRGDRDRNRGRERGERGGERSRDGGRGGRGGRESRAPRVPRGFSPSRSLYGVESTPTLDDAGTGADEASTSQPMILPGESLSKYRTPTPAETAAAASAPAAAAPQPAAAFTLAGAWDGSDVLPGESLQRRPRGASASQGAPRAESRFSSRSETAPVTPVAASSAPEPVSTSTQELPTSGSVAKISAAAADPSPAPTPDLRHAGTSALEADVEYEPVEASASLRFDPNPPSEYRQSAPPSTEASTPPEPEDSEDVPSHPTEEPSSIAHSITPQPGVPLAALHVDADYTFDAPATHAGYTDLPEVEPAAELFPDHNSEHTDHDFTSITPGGEMFSEPKLPAYEQEFSEPSAPIHHETAVVDEEPTDLPPSDRSVAQAPESQAAVAAHTDDVHSFAPGDGTLEEEMMDDEEFDAPTMRANAVGDATDEEETIEGAADLGSMIRELSIDQITRAPEPEELDDDEILEEEEAAHEGLYVDAEDPDERGFEGAESMGSEISDDDLIPAELTDTSEASFGAVAQDREPSGTTERDRSDRGRRDGGRRGDGRGRDRDRGRDRSSGNADRSSSASDRSSGNTDRSSSERTSRPGRRDGRHSMQTTNLPAISDLLKPGQEVLVQIAKEPIAKKGARITSHIALPGRFLVFMPTVNHTGVSRKIESDGERRRLKEILLSEKGEAAGGFIVRTAAAGASEEELRSDLRFLLNLWADIKQRSESSKSPALIYHDLNLVERILRDQVTDTFSAIWVDTEDAYERVLRFLQRFQPSLIRRVKLYTKDTPLFEQFGITEEINKALRSKVWLKSGGSIVINQTEALVAIDINTGKYVGKTARLEDTIVKTNLDAIPEIVRQIRLRDLGGIIIIDFIDMDERKNRNRVMAALEDELKKDRAPSKVLQFNDFGLVAITRKRVKQSLERTLSATCNICQGTGMTKSPVTICNDIFVEMRKMQKHLDRGDVMLRVNPEVVKQLKSPGTRWLQEMEELVGKTILVKSDPALHPEQFDIH